MKEVYKHTEDVHHNDKSPSEIVPVLMNIFSPNSVIDIGCGVGNFLKEFEKRGVSKIKGLDGAWADKEEINKNISNNFVEFNLNNIFKPELKFDLAVSLEVAEHIDEKYANNFVETLCNSSDNIIFSAAIPLQGGQNHINEQWNEYWQEKFGARGYMKMDFLKNYFWNNKNIFWWYKQNIIFYTREPDRFITYQNCTLQNVVHPELFKQKTEELELRRKNYEEYKNVINGEYSWKFYLYHLMKKIF